MAIRMRRGLLDELDESKLLAGEWAVTIDPETNRQKVLMCFGGGIVKQMGTYNDFQQMIEEIADDLLEDFKKEIQPIKTEIEQMASDVSSDKADVVVIKNDITDRILPLIEGYVESAEGFAESAGTSSDNARTYAGNALESAELSGDYATLAESYTHGGTGKRAGEDTDNAKYYMEQAKASAGGDYVARTEIGITVAGLVDGKVPESQLPEIGGKVEVDGTTITQNPDTKVISVAKDITDKVGEVDKLKEDLDRHKDSLVMSAEGVHGFRYHEEKLEAKDEDGAWHEIETAGGVKSVITVTTIDFIGETATCSNGLETLTETFSSTGNLAFYVSTVGEYVISCEDEVVTVNVDILGGVYLTELNKIYSTIVVKTSDDFLLGKDIIVSNGDLSYTKTFPSSFTSEIAEVEFVVKKIGIYTIICDTATSSVEITEWYQSKVSELTTKIYLYNEGDENEELTGGFAVKSFRFQDTSGQPYRNPIVKTEDGLTALDGDKEWSITRTNNKVNLNNKKIKITIKDSDSTGLRVQLGFNDDENYILPSTYQPWYMYQNGTHVINETISGTGYFWIALLAKGKLSKIEVID